MNAPAATTPEEFWSSTEPATKETLDRIARAIRHPKVWTRVRSFGSQINVLRGGVNVYTGRDEEMMASTGCTTAFTDFNSINFMEKFLNKLTPLGALFVMFHESAHIVLLHHTRRGGRDPHTWNLSCDAVINRLLLEELIPLITGLKGPIRPDQLFVPGVPPLGIGMTAATRHWMDEIREATEEIFYSDLKSNKTTSRLEEKTKRSKSPGGGGGGGGGAGNPDYGQDPWDDTSSDRNFDEHTSPAEMRRRLIETFGDEGRELADRMGLPETDDNLDHLNRTAVARAHEEDRRAQAMNANKGGWGGHMDSFTKGAIQVDKENQAKTTWEIRVAGLVDTATSGEWQEDPTTGNELYEWSRIPGHPMHEAAGGTVWQPQLVRKAGRANILVIIDTSGSVSREEHIMFSRELREMVHSCIDSGTGSTFINMMIVTADTRPCERKLLKIGDISDLPDVLEIAGGGGTDMLTPLYTETCLGMVDPENDDGEYVPYDLAVIFSDGEFQAFSYEELTAEMRKQPKGTERIEHIPPIINVNSRPFYDSGMLQDVKESFANKGKVFEMFSLTTMERNARIAVDQGHASISGPTGMESPSP